MDKSLKSPREGSEGKYNIAIIRGKVMAGSFRMELIRIGYIEIDKRIPKEP
jgi:hypothetical protein